MRRKPNTHLERMTFLVQRINEINEWRNEAVKHAVTQEQKDRVDARALELREAAERQ